MTNDLQRRVVNIGFTVDIIIILAALVLLYFSNKGMVPVVWMWVSVVALAAALLSLGLWIFIKTQSHDEPAQEPEETT
ncbi:MAG: hypothetical protein II786_01865 [Muribaculaceae bacterium]|nr:hypothetical protein [Muribaculaceae bacterium]MBR3100731.1 hypothetical protein [Muribaculaceae bacterium]